MRNKQEILISSGAFILTGAFISFLLLIRIDHIGQAILIGFFYSVVLVGALTFVRNFVIRKLTVFPIAQQWFFRSIIYTITISFSYLIGVLFQAIVLTPPDQIRQVIVDRVWQTFVELVSSPFDLEFSRIFPDLQQPVFIVFFAVLIFIACISLIGSFVEVKWRENRSRQMRANAELHTLKSQIEPHFLFNTLNTITSLIKQDPDKAEDMIIQLSEILQFRSLHAKNECIGLGDEISFTKKYVRLLEARFEDSFRVKWHEEFHDPDFKVPVLILQPLIENCVRHAWQDKNKMLEIDLILRKNEGNVELNVVDNGIGISENLLKKLPVKNHALANISERLQVMYGKNNLLTLKSISGESTTVTIHLPENCHDQNNTS